jgi:hypothetical protein
MLARDVGDGAADVAAEEIEPVAAERGVATDVERPR